MKRSFFGTGFSLGGLPTSQQSDLLLEIEPVYRLSDQLVGLTNTAATLLQADVSAWRDEADALRAAADRLGDNVALLNSEADLEQWRAELAALVVTGNELRAELQSSLAAAQSGRSWKMGLWTAGVVLAGVGTILAIRRYGRRRGRR